MNHLSQMKILRTKETRPEWEKQLTIYDPLEILPEEIREDYHVVPAVSFETWRTGLPKTRVQTAATPASSPIKGLTGTSVAAEEDSHSETSTTPAPGNAN